LPLKELAREDAFRGFGVKSKPLWRRFLRRSFGFQRDQILVRRLWLDASSSA